MPPATRLIWALPSGARLRIRGRPAGHRLNTGYMPRSGRIIGKISAILDPVLSSRPVTRMLGVQSVGLRYRGRRSGKPIELTVWAKPTAIGLDVQVAAASGKTWWRNFADAGQPVEVFRDGVWRSGTAVAQERNRKVVVHITLGDEASAAD